MNWFRSLPRVEALRVSLLKQFRNGRSIPSEQETRPGICLLRGMKRAAFKLAPSKGGWIRTTIAPLNDKREARFGLMDALMFCTLVSVVVAVARVLIAR